MQLIHYDLYWQIARIRCRQYNTAIDRDGHPHWVHCYAVAAGVEDLVDQSVGFLHDIIEDTTYPVEHLRSEFPGEIAEAVLALTRLPGESANAYFRKVMQNERAKRVKVSDIRHNFSPGRRDDRTLRSLSMYERWHARLCQEIGVPVVSLLELAPVTQ